MRDEEFIIAFFMYVLPAILVTLSTVQTKDKESFGRLLLFKKKNKIILITFFSLVQLNLLPCRCADV